MGAKGWPVPLYHPWAVSRRCQARQHQKAAKTASAPFFPLPRCEQKSWDICWQREYTLAGYFTCHFFLQEANIFCSSLLPGGCTMFIHPYAMLPHGRDASSLKAHSPVQVLHLPTIWFVSCRVLEGHFIKLLHPHLSIGRGAEDA